MSFIGLKLYPMPVDTILRITEAVDFLGTASSEKAAKFAGVGSTTAYKALLNASHLGLVKKISGENYTYVHMNPLKGTPPAEKRRLFQLLLQVCRPFEVLCQFLSYGDDESAAMRKASVVLGDNNLVKNALPVLSKWGVDIGILARDKTGALRLAETLKEELKAISQALEIKLGNEFEIGLYLGRRLTAQCYEFLKIPERQRLTQAFIDSEQHPEKSCEENGKAFENFLRLIAKMKGVDVSRRNGIGQVAEELAKYGVIHKKHKNMCLAVGAVRTVSAHDRDKVSNIPWTKTPEMAHAVLSYSLSVMRSIYLWVFEGKQEL
ncbi:MAG: hypothetical protein JSW24_01395 [Dehalococcoidia bacterium]|nr:MAG: hypothetical protein JSW24_01395 [Dehalococcoidia bacterium]